MLLLQHITKKFGTLCAVDDVSLEIETNEMVGVIGCSGAGKSTLLRLINRLIDPTEGKIIFDNTEVTALKGVELRQWRAQCAMIFQQFNLVPRLNVISNVLIGRLRYQNTICSLLKMFSKPERAKAIKALHRLGMAGTALQRAETLSGGQQQRVAITKALVQDPQIVLADEPIASLDPGNATIVMEALKSIQEDFGIMVLCNLHNLDTTKRYCTRIIGMSKGRIVFDGKSSELTIKKAQEIYGEEGVTELKEANYATNRYMQEMVCN